MISKNCLQNLTKSTFFKIYLEMKLKVLINLCIDILCIEPKKINLLMIKCRETKNAAIIK